VLAYSKIPKYEIPIKYSLPSSRTVKKKKVDINNLLAKVRQEKNKEKKETNREINELLHRMLTIKNQLFFHQGGFSSGYGIPQEGDFDFDLVDTPEENEELSAELQGIRLKIADHYRRFFKEERTISSSARE
jgi:hypothetical protein